ncbi:MAG: hypothetical protein V2B13_20395 [Pseudomonadota bacterium]
MMRPEDFYFEGEKCSSWVCFLCGETIDEEILKNRRGSLPAKEKKISLEGRGQRDLDGCPNHSEGSPRAFSLNPENLLGIVLGSEKSLGQKTS